MGLTAKFISHEISTTKTNFGEIKFIEENFYIFCFCKMQEGSEWIELISAAEIRTPGSAEVILSAGHVKRMRYVQQVNGAALYKLLHQTWEKSKSDDIDTSVICKSLYYTRESNL